MDSHGIARQAQCRSTDRPAREFLKDEFPEGARQPCAKARGKALAGCGTSVRLVPAKRRMLLHDSRAAKCSREVCGARPTPAKRFRSAAHALRAGHATVGA